jgi:hypothetical protein
VNIQSFFDWHTREGAEGVSEHPLRVSGALAQETQGGASATSKASNKPSLPSNAITARLGPL